jgi:hypothetical protein
MDYDALEIEAALSDMHEQVIETLAAAALALYLVESFNILEYSLARGIIPDEAYQVLRTSDLAKIMQAPAGERGSQVQKVLPKQQQISIASEVYEKSIIPDIPKPVITPSITPKTTPKLLVKPIRVHPQLAPSQTVQALIPKVDDFKEIYSVPAQKYADKYKDDLLRGGRTVRVGIWGEFDKTLGYKPYLGYEEKWAPWLNNFTDESRSEIYSIITDANARGLWPDIKEHNRGGYTKGSLADELNDFFNKRRSHASMVARSETQHLRAMARMERHDALGYDTYRWLCGMDPCDMCSQFDKQEFDRANLPMGGDKVHPHCECEVVVVIEV